MKTLLVSNLLILVLLAGFTAGCVGTIEDTEIKKTKTVPTDLPPIRFDGILKAEPIAHDKVEIFFFPAPGDPSELAYEINYDGLSTPISVPAINLRPDYRGYLTYTIIGLQTDSTYNIEVQAKNLKTTARSNATKQLKATTFGNITANFLGIQSVAPMPGIAGMNAIKVKWSEAEKQGSAFVPKEIDPANYEITILDGEVQTPLDMNNPNLVDPDRKVVLVAPDKISAVVGGLFDDNEYFVQVRAIHHGYTLYGADLNYQKEANTKYLPVKTLSADLADLTFDETSISVALSPGKAGLGSVIVSWLPATGAFDHYRIYSSNVGSANLVLHTPDATCDGQEDSDPNVYCKQVVFDKFQGTLVDLPHNTEQQFMVAVCQGYYCSPAQRKISDIKTITTTPNVALFSGILSIDYARHLDQLDYLYLNVNKPEESTGILDGILVVYKHPTLGDIYLNHPDPVGIYENTSSLNVLSFNYQVDTEYIITGVDPFSLDAYCFSAFPYTTVAGVVVEHRTNEVIQCTLPQVIPPQLDSFTGIKSCSPSDIHLSVTWDAVTEGIFSHYEIFVLPDGMGAFDFGQATSGNPNYDRYLVSSINTDGFTIDSLGAGTYWVGVLTWAQVSEGGLPLRSPFNGVAIQCVIP